MRPAVRLDITVKLLLDAVVRYAPQCSIIVPVKLILRPTVLGHLTSHGVAHSQVYPVDRGATTLQERM